MGYSPYSSYKNLPSNIAFMKCIVVHYSEIGTKGGNRRWFEKRLADNIRNSVGGEVKRINGRIIIKNPKHEEKLKYISGIYSYALGEEVASDLSAIKKTALELAKKSKAKTFRVTATRSDKSFPYTSMKVNEIVGGEVWKKTKKKVKLKDADLEIFIEIVGGSAYVFGEKILCIGGMPVGTAGRLVCLMSGGIDSPVAAYRMMTRGCKIVFVHFHNHDPFVKKITDLVKILSQYQGKSKLYLVPFKAIQQQIIKKTDPRYRMIIYRRVMMQIAEDIMHKEHALGLITGDSVAQVASQTLENINSIYDAVKTPIFAPLIGTHKQEIIETARGIGTYETSIRPYTDCCSVLVAKHPATKSTVEEVRAMEKKLRIKTLIKKTMKETEIVKI